MHLLIVLCSTVLVLVACQTSEKERRSERLSPASRAGQTSEASGPTVEGKSGLKTKKKRCDPSDSADAGKRERDPTVDVGVQSDIRKGGVGKPQPYAAVHCDD